MTKGQKIFEQTKGAWAVIVSGMGIKSVMTDFTWDETEGEALMTISEPNDECYDEIYALTKKDFEGAKVDASGIVTFHTPGHRNGEEVRLKFLTILRVVA